MAWIQLVLLDGISSSPSEKSDWNDKTCGRRNAPRSCWRRWICAWTQTKLFIARMRWVKGRPPWIRWRHFLIGKLVTKVAEVQYEGDVLVVHGGLSGALVDAAFGLQHSWNSCDRSCAWRNASQLAWCDMATNPTMQSKHWWLSLAAASNWLTGIDWTAWFVSKGSKRRIVNWRECGETPWSIGSMA